MAAHGGTHEYSGRPRRCSAGEHAPRALSTSPPIGWAAPRAWSSPPRPAGSNDLVGAERPVRQLRRAWSDLNGSRSLPAFARDDYYIGAHYEVTGSKGHSPQRRREGRCEGAIAQAMCGESAFTCSRPSARSDQGKNRSRTGRRRASAPQTQYAQHRAAY